MPQTTYTIDHAAAIAGQVVNGETHRGRYENSELLNFGRVCELHTDGLLRQPQATTLGKVIGGVPYNASLPPGGWTTGDYMPRILREGQMWIAYTGTAPATESKPNVCHASDDTAGNAQHRGKVTGSATSVVAGAEVSAFSLGGFIVIKVDTVLSLALCEFNLP